MRIIKWLALGGLSVAAALLLSVPLKKVVRAQIMKAKPYTIQYRAVATGLGKKAEYSYLVAQNTEGDTVQEDGGDSNLRYIRQPTKGLSIAVSPKYRMTLGDGKPTPLFSMGSQCENYTNRTGQTKEILGFITYQVTSRHQEPNGLVETEEEWIAPKLDCSALEKHFKWTNVGASDSDTSEEAVYAIAGEPDATLFQIDANLQEVPPSQFFPALGKPIPNPRLEAGYWNDQKKRASGQP